MTIIGEKSTNNNNTHNMEEEDEKPRTILIGNIPKSTHKREIENIFGEIGPLKRCYIQYPRQDKKKPRQGDQSNTSLLCYVTFALAEDAVKALETLGSNKIGGNKIHMKFAKTRSEQIRPKADFAPSFQETDPSTTTELEDQDSSTQKRGNNKRKLDEDKRFNHKNPNLIPVEGENEDKKPKGPRPKTISKKSRLIIRNLSFKVTEEKMKEYFGTCGEIKDVNILKKPDGKLVGCAFIQYDTVPQAAKAVRELNLKPFLGRPIAIDWALPKKDFQDDKDEGSEIKEIKIADDDDDEDVKIKAEPDESAMDEGDDEDVKFINPYDSMGVEIKAEDPQQKPNKKRKIKQESDSDDDDDDDDDDSDNEKEKKPQLQKTRSNDVEEGKTLFLRNLDFGVTQDDLKKFFETYGPIHYALLCKDNLTEHPKGTGFVKFRNLEDANKCLTDFNVESTKFTLGNRFFTITVALSKERVSSSNKTNSTTAGDKKTEKIKQDNRNLYLVREGFIRPGSSAAEGVSISDMNKRTALNSTKKQLLKNLSIFVSPTRLCVHNLPIKLNDKTLRKLFKKYSSPDSRITEARIMRDMKDIQLGGKGQSKGYGFVTFKEHEHALAALRTINNNPEIFASNLRPIVEFSLENRKALQAKEKRMQKSIENNKMAPKKSKIKKVVQENTDSSTNNTTSPEDTTSTPVQQKKSPQKHKNPGNNKSVPAKNPQQQQKHGKQGNERQFSGLTSKVGVSKLPVMKAKGNKTGKITRKSLKGSRSQKKKFEERRMREPQIKPKKIIDKDYNKSEKLVSKYKRNLEKATGGDDGGKKSKWYN